MIDDVFSVLSVSDIDELARAASEVVKSSGYGDITAKFRKGRLWMIEVRITYLVERDGEHVDASRERGEA